VPLRAATSAVDLQQLPLTYEVANRHQFEAETLWLASAPGLISIPLQLDQLGKARGQLGDQPRLVIGQAAVENGNGAIWLTIDMRQDQAVGIDNPTISSIV
jgi:hypothetical protein